MALENFEGVKIERILREHVHVSVPMSAKHALLDYLAEEGWLLERHGADRDDRTRFTARVSREYTSQ